MLSDSGSIVGFMTSSSEKKRKQNKTIETVVAQVLIVVFSLSFQKLNDTICNITKNRNHFIEQQHA